MSRPAFEILQRGRSLVFRFLTPLDAALRRLQGRQSLPPLWLRRHTGPLRNYLAAARDTRDTLERENLIGPTHCVLDVGCGTGVMAAEFASLLGTAGRYIGFDVHRSSIRWCRRAFASDARFEFHEAVIASPYGRGRSAPATTYRFPAPDHTVDLVLAKSVFTHLLPPAALHYLTEIRRTLRPGGTAMITVFLFAPASRTGRGESPWFSLGGTASVVRWRWRARPEAAVAYEMQHFTEMAHQARLEIVKFLPGFWPGEAGQPQGQDVLLLRHSPSS